MADAAGGVTSRIRGWAKGLIGLVLGVGSAAAVSSGTSVLDRVIRPTKPVANFSVAADGLTVTCQNHASGESGWWDFGDGTPLEPFDPAQPAVTHGYPKPGTYAVKLTVRNFLAEENERSVGVDLTGATAAAAASITGLTVEPLNGKAVAPAGFVVRGKVEGVSTVVFDCTGKTPQTDIRPGSFEKFVVFDTPGEHEVRLIGWTGTQTPVKQEARVRVEPAPAGSLSVKVWAVDAGTLTESRPDLHTEPVPVPKAGETTFARTISVPLGMTVADAKVRDIRGAAAKAVKSVKIEVAADKKSAKLTGEWAGDPAAVAKLAGGSDVPVPVQLTLAGKPRSERRSPGAVSAGFDAAGVAAVNLPPAPPPAAGLTRSLRLEVAMATPGGKPTVVHTVENLVLPATFQVPTQGGRPAAFTAQMGAGGKLEVRRAGG